MGFEPHGDIEVAADYPLLVTVVNGPWNRELVELWQTEVAPRARQLAAQGPWVGCGVMRQSMLCTAEALELLGAVSRVLASDLGAVGVAHVANEDVDGAQFMEPVYRELYGDVLPYLQCQSIEEARRWARTLIDPPQR